MNLSTALRILGLLVTIFQFVISDGVVSFNRMQFSEREQLKQLCENKRTKCTTSQTCCATEFNGYNCCPYANAVCCSDKFHCCPQNYKCDLKARRCIKSNNEMLKLIPSSNLIGSQQVAGLLDASYLPKLGRDQTCPNNKTKCKDTKTCCITKHGNYYCCPHKNAVCCSDKYHCCPEGSTCDLKNNKCTSPSKHTDIFVYKPNVDQPHALTPSRKVNFIDFVLKLEKKCSDNKYKCPGEKRCCAMTSGGFGCCTFDKGVCCPDMKTCCPHGTECDATNNKCTIPPSKLVPIPKVDSENIEVKSGTVCPNKKIECQPFETCCSVGYDSYGCCPFKNATCCSDLQSCCPHNKKCDLKKKMCVPGNEINYAIVARKSLINYVNDIGLKNVCPDNTKCSGNETCCPTIDNSFGCCPYNFGVCCPDHKTCCNKGFVCVENGCKMAVL